MKKLTFLLGLGAGFVLGSSMGRGPYEQLEGAVRQIVNDPKVQKTLDSAADSAQSVRDSALDATSGAIDEASHAASKAIDDTSKRFSGGTQRTGSKVGHTA